MCHPTELRAITVGEAAAIQEFPRDWQFSGNATAKFRQVGNAVPTRLGRVAGEMVQALLRRIVAGERDDNAAQSRIVHLRPHVRTRIFWKGGQVFAGDHSYYDEDEDSDMDQPRQLALALGADD